MNTILNDTDMLIAPENLFAQITNQSAKTFSYRYDEALRQFPQHALAMRRDALIEALLQERYCPTANRSWQICPEDEHNSDQIRIANILSQLIERIPYWSRLLYQLLEAIWYGRAGVQIQWGKQKIRGQEYWGILNHLPVQGDKIQFTWQGEPAILINPMSRQNYPDSCLVNTDRGLALILRKSIWRDQFIIHKHIPSDADFFQGEMAGGIHGVGLRSKLYWCWWLRGEMLSWAVDYMKKVGTLGLLIFWYEINNKTAKQIAETAAQTASKSNVLVMGRASSASSSWGVEQLQPSTVGIEALQQMIQHYFELQMERLIIGQSLSARTEGNGLGGKGVATLHADTKYNLLKFDADNLAETVRAELISRLLHYNFPACTDHYTFQLLVPRPDNHEKIATIQSAYEMGVPFAVREIRELTGLNQPAAGDQIIQKRASLG